MVTMCTTTYAKFGEEELEIEVEVEEADPAAAAQGLRAAVQALQVSESAPAGEAS